MVPLCREYKDTPSVCTRKAAIQSAKTEGLKTIYVWKSGKTFGHRDFIPIYTFLEDDIVDMMHGELIEDHVIDQVSDDVIAKWLEGKGVSLEYSTVDDIEEVPNNE